MLLSICIGLIMALNFVIGIQYGLLSNYSMALVFICYGVANLGIYLGAK